jgi:protein-S-isoprenylcysteine O-methyltransferase Ste14
MYKVWQVNNPSRARCWRLTLLTFKLLPAFKFHTVAGAKNVINFHITSNCSDVSKLGQRRPVFELHGFFAKIDLSAWISAAAYMLGVSIIGSKKLFASLHQSEFDFIEVTSSLLIFLAVVMLIQKHMGLSIRSHEFGKPKTLSTHGPYAYSRNPIYVAFLLPLASFAFISITAATLAMVFYITAMNLTVIRTEERELLRIFGDDYRRSASKVRRWI